MSKLEETNLLIDYIAKLKESNLNVDNTIILADIAKSLAMIADKLCGTKSEEQNLDIKQEPTEWQKDYEILKAYSDGANEVLRNIIAETEALSLIHTSPLELKQNYLAIIYKYMEKVEERKREYETIYSNTRDRR